MGAILQLLGVLLVFFEIAQTERQFNRKPWLREGLHRVLAPWRWIRRQLGRKSPIAGQGNVSMSGTVSATGTLSATLLRNPQQTVEQRLASLQGELDTSRRELEELSRRMEEHRVQFDRALIDAVARINASIQSLREVVTDLGVGSIWGRVAGGILIVVGTILTIASEFVA